MTFDEMNGELAQAKNDMRIVERHVTGMVKLCAGRLRHTDGSFGAVDALRKLKAELRDFDSRTGCWKK